MYITMENAIGNIGLLRVIKRPKLFVISIGCKMKKPCWCFLHYEQGHLVLLNKLVKESKK